MAIQGEVLTMTIAEAVAARDALLDMLGAGILESGHGDKRIKFATFDELRARIDYLNRFISGVTNARPRAGRVRFGGQE